MYLLPPLLCCDSISKQVTIQNTSIRQKENSPRTITTDYLLNGSLRKRLNRTASHHYGVALCVMAPRLYCVRPSATCHNARPLFCSQPKSPMSLLKCCEVEKLYHGSERMVVIHEYYNTLHLDEMLRASAPNNKSQTENRCLAPESSSHSIEPVSGQHAYNKRTEKWNKQTESSDYFF